MNPAQLAIATGWEILDGLAIESSSAMTYHVISVMEKSAGPVRRRLGMVPRRCSKLSALTSAFSARLRSLT
jgi:hypothetical protein